MVDDSVSKGKRDKVPSVPSLPDSFSCPHCRKRHPMFMAKCTESGQPIDRVFKMEGQLLESKYRVGKLLAQGGMGVVYEGTHTKIGRRLAIKFLMGTGTASRELMARFQNEARIAASIGHRNIVDILDMGTTTSGMPFIVMEYLDGRDLGSILDDVIRLPQQLAVEVAIQILGALRAVHQQDVIHRDLKPENVFVIHEQDSGILVKLVDFGISRLAPARKQNLSLTRTGAVFGTPRYMAPEQARGRKGVDHRADLYSVGVILYELLTGAIPFEADDYNNMIIAITTEDPLRVSQHGVLIEDVLSTVVMKAISRNPDERFQSADEFISVLGEFRGIGAEGLDISGIFGSAAVDESKVSSIRLVGPDGSEIHHRPIHETPTMGPGAGSPGSSLDVWEESAIRSEPPPGPRRSSLARTVLLVVAIPLIILVAGGAMALIILELMDIAGGRASAAAASDGSFEEVPAPVAPVAVQPAQVDMWQVQLMGVPADADVQIDGTLHPERPILVPEAPGARTVEVIAADHAVWKKEVAIHADLTLHVTLEKSSPPRPEPVPDPGPLKKEKAEKTVKGTKQKGDPDPKDEKKNKIDIVYPGMKK